MRVFEFDPRLNFPTSIPADQPLRRVRGPVPYALFRALIRVISRARNYGPSRDPLSGHTYWSPDKYLIDICPVSSPRTTDRVIFLAFDDSRG